MNIYMICTLWTPFQAERDWKNSYREILLIPLYIFYSLWMQIVWRQRIIYQGVWNKREKESTRPAIPYYCSCFADSTPFEYDVYRVHVFRISYCMHWTVKKIGWITPNKHTFFKMQKYWQKTKFKNACIILLHSILLLNRYKWKI